ncbi:unnamed protein product [Prunus armeniaca]
MDGCMGFMPWKEGGVGGEGKEEEKRKKRRKKETAVGRKGRRNEEQRRKEEEKECFPLFARGGRRKKLLMDALRPRSDFNQTIVRPSKEPLHGIGSFTTSGSRLYVSDQMMWSE